MRRVSDRDPDWRDASRWSSARQVPGWALRCRRTSASAQRRGDAFRGFPYRAMPRARGVVTSLQSGRPPPACGRAVRCSGEARRAICRARWLVLAPARVPAWARWGSTGPPPAAAPSAPADGSGSGARCGRGRQSESGRSPASLGRTACAAPVSAPRRANGRPGGADPVAISSGRSNAAVDDLTRTAPPRGDPIDVATAAMSGFLPPRTQRSSAGSTVLSAVPARRGSRLAAGHGLSARTRPSGAVGRRCGRSRGQPAPCGTARRASRQPRVLPVR